MISQPLQERQQIVQLSDRQGITLKLYNLLPHPKGQSDSDHRNHKLYSQKAGWLGDDLEDKKLWRQKIISLHSERVCYTPVDILLNELQFHVLKVSQICSVWSHVSDKIHKREEDTEFIFNKCTFVLPALTRLHLNKPVLSLQERHHSDLENKC